MALTKDKVLIAGTKDILRTENMSRETIAKQAELLESSDEQYFEIYSKKDGSKIASFKLPGKPLYDGMAIAQGKSSRIDLSCCAIPGC